MVVLCVYLFFFFKQKTAYEMRISDWSSDVCSSDLSGLDSDGARRSGYGLRRVGRAGPHRQLRVGRGVRTVDGAAVVRHRSATREGHMNPEQIDIGPARYSAWAFTSSAPVLLGGLLLLSLILASNRTRPAEQHQPLSAT